MEAKDRLDRTLQRSPTERIVFVLYAPWNRNFIHHQQSILAFLRSEQKKTIFVLFKLSNVDDEDFFIDQGCTSLPCLMIHKDSNCHFSKFFSTPDNAIDRFFDLFDFLSESVSSPSSPIRLFIGGDKAGIGKSSVCNSLLLHILSLGFTCHDIAYIKPVTQCVEDQPVAELCRQLGIDHVAIGPVVFYSGFTRQFLAGTAGTSQDLLQSAIEAVRTVERGKKFVIIDGVGYPSVGSVCGICNAKLAKQLNAPVIIVQASGVGDAIDSFNLNKTYFESFGCHVLGAIFNRFPLTGFYSLEACSTAINSYFDQYMSPDIIAYGFVPDVPNFDEISDQLVPAKRKWSEVIGVSTPCMNTYKIFANYVSLDRLVSDCISHALNQTANASSTSNESGLNV